MNLNTKTILLVEDDSILAIDGKIKLEKYGIKVITASNGKDAINIIKTHKMPDLILMDIELGCEMNGIQTAKIILENYNIPLVFHSSYVGSEIEAEAENVKSYGYVIKNSSEFILITTIIDAFKKFENEKNTCGKNI